MGPSQVDTDMERYGSWRAKRKPVFWRLERTRTVLQIKVGVERFTFAAPVPLWYASPARHFGLRRDAGRGRVTVATIALSSS